LPGRRPFRDPRSPGAVQRAH